MKILHTSDWHLGLRLYEQNRDEEIQQWLDWLIETIEKEKIDALIVAGDIFDVSTPSIAAQTQFNSTLARLATLGVQTVIVGGNHDSGYLIDSNKPFEPWLNVKVVGHPSDNPSDDIVMLRDRLGRERVVLGAVPYLRPAYLRKPFEDFESYGKDLDIEENQWEHQLKLGLARFYETMGSAVNSLADVLQTRLHFRPKTMVTGHLMCAGVSTFSQDGVHSLYIGKLDSVGADIFPEVDYVALGHIHQPQCVAKRPNIRYSGTPYPCSFSEANVEKSVVVITLDDEDLEAPLQIDTLACPRFIHLLRFKGDEETIKAAIAATPEFSGEAAFKVFAEVTYTSDKENWSLEPSFRYDLRIKGITMLHFQWIRPSLENAKPTLTEEALEEINPLVMFDLLLEREDAIASPDKSELKTIFEKIYLDFQHKHDSLDRRAFVTWAPASRSDSTTKKE